MPAVGKEDIGGKDGERFPVQGEAGLQHPDQLFFLRGISLRLAVAEAANFGLRHSGMNSGLVFCMTSGTLQLLIFNVKTVVEDDGLLHGRPGEMGVPEKGDYG